jgi:hypothetical protein
VSKFGIVTSGGHTAQFEVLGDVLHVTSEFGVKKTQLGDLPAEMLAGRLLREQIAEAKLKL